MANSNGNGGSGTSGNGHGGRRPGVGRKSKDLVILQGKWREYAARWMTEERVGQLLEGLHAQAKRGNPAAIGFFATYIFGKPPEDKAALPGGLTLVYAPSIAALPALPALPPPQEVP